MVTFSLSAVTTYFVPYAFDYLTIHNLGSIIGLFMLLLASGITLNAYRAFRVNHTPYKPYTKPKVLITSGVYALSRNPIYLALVMSHAALGFIAGSLWIILAAFVLLLLLDRTVVADEEEILKHRFPRSYPSYRSKTRRWL
jgi:protein-S-isoprenylcysteine O-methyltransferase Ste14